MRTLFKDGLPETPKAVQEIFLKNNSAAGLFFAALLLNEDVDGVEMEMLLKRSAQMGYAKAKSFLFEFCIDDYLVQRVWRDEAAEQNDATALCRIASLYEQRDPSQAAALYKEAALLGDAEAQYFHGKTIDKNDERRYYFWKQAIKGEYYDEIVEELINKQVPKQFLFDLGKGFRNLPNGLPFQFYTMESETEGTMSAVDAYDSVCEKAKQAIYCWMMITKRTPFKHFVPKDVAKIIGRMLLKGIDAWRPERRHNNSTTTKKARN